MGYKKILVLAVISMGILLNSCINSENSVKNEHKSHFKMVQQKDSFGNSKENNQVEIDLEYPQLDEWSDATQKINQSITNSIFSKMGLSQVSDTTSYKSFFKKVKNEYNILVHDFPKTSSIGLKQKTRGEISTFSESILSVYLSTYVYTGGAHGMEYREFLNFDPISGEQVDLMNYIENKLAFVYFAETKLREKLDMRSYDNWSDHTFLQEFKLPKNIGMTDDGYRLIYNQYELLSYAEGHTEITISFKELK